MSGRVSYKLKVGIPLVPLCRRDFIFRTEGACGSVGQFILHDSAGRVMYFCTPAGKAYDTAVLSVRFREPQDAVHHLQSLKNRN